MQIHLKKDNLTKNSAKMFSVRKQLLKHTKSSITFVQEAQVTSQPGSSVKLPPILQVWKVQDWDCHVVWHEGYKEKPEQGNVRWGSVYLKKQPKKSLGKAVKVKLTLQCISQGATCDRIMGHPP